MSRCPNDCCILCWNDGEKVASAEIVPGIGRVCDTCFDYAIEIGFFGIEEIDDDGEEAVNESFVH